MNGSDGHDKLTRQAVHIGSLEGVVRRRNEQIVALQKKLEQIQTATFDERLADAWDEGERHESDYLNTWGQFCPGKNCNPYRKVQ